MFPWRMAARMHGRDAPSSAAGHAARLSPVIVTAADRSGAAA